MNTSLEAFLSLDEGEMEKVRVALLRAAAVRPGTVAELAARCGLTQYQASKRASELVKGGGLVRLRLGQNPSGRRAWVLGAA